MKKGASEKFEYTPEMGARICDLIVEGYTLREIEALPDMPGERTILKWAWRRPDFGQQYARARTESANAHAEDVARIGRQLLNGELSVPSDVARVAIDAAKWTAGRRNPKVWGEKAETTVNAGDGWAEVMSKAGAVPVFPKRGENGDD